MGDVSPGRPIRVFLRFFTYFAFNLSAFAQDEPRTAGIAHFDPAARARGRVRRQYRILLAGISDTRLLVPDAQTWHLSGLIAGTLTCTQGFQPYQRKECLNDALIYLTAAKQRLPVVTANRTDFDLIQQFAAGGSFLYF